MKMISINSLGNQKKKAAKARGGIHSEGKHKMPTTINQSNAAERKTTSPNNRTNTNLIIVSRSNKAIDASLPTTTMTKLNGRRLIQI